MAMAGQLVEVLLGEAQRAPTDLGMKLAKMSLAANMQAPPGTASANGAGSLVDMVA